MRANGDDNTTTLRPMPAISVLAAFVNDREHKDYFADAASCLERVRRAKRERERAGAISTLMKSIKSCACH